MVVPHSGVGLLFARYRNESLRHAENCVGFRNLLHPSRYGRKRFPSRFPPTSYYFNVAFDGGFRRALLHCLITGQVALLDVFYFADDSVSLFSLPSSRQPRTVNQSTKKCLGTASATNGVRQSTR